MAERRYAIQAFSERDRSLLKSIMALLNVRTQHSWSETETLHGSHVVFVNMDVPEGEQAWDELKDRPRVWCSQQPSTAADYTLQLPVKLATLEPLIQSLEQQLPDVAEPAQTEATETPQTPDDFPHIRGL